MSAKHCDPIPFLQTLWAHITPLLVWQVHVLICSVKFTDDFNLYTASNLFFSTVPPLFSLHQGQETSRVKTGEKTQHEGELTHPAGGSFNQEKCQCELLLSFSPPLQPSLRSPSTPGHNAPPPPPPYSNFLTHHSPVTLWVTFTIRTESKMTTTPTPSTKTSESFTVLSSW